MLRYAAGSNLEGNERGSPKRLVFFVVDKVALAIQQAEFLQRTCPGRIGVLFGALGVDNYSPAQWKDVYSRHDVVVLTADIMKDCLARNILHMSTISLLIYDECHHARKAHPYALIQEFYHTVAPEQRPRIFGMTASPIGARGSPAHQASGLEQILDARICTPDRRSVSDESGIRSKEYFCIYESLAGQYESLEFMDHDMKASLACIGASRRPLGAAADAGIIELRTLRTCN
jgi:endoribonuclease Dicer